jgi:molybdopterin-guanine dinucleotide biosynthesis protein A
MRLLKRVDILLRNSKFEQPFGNRSIMSTEKASGSKAMISVKGEDTLKVAGVILAGGRSSRMGVGKALLSIEGRRLIDRTISVLNELKPWVSRVVISGDIPKLESIPDREPYSGPVGGIASVARRLIDEGVEGLLVVPVDLPLLSADTLKPILEYTDSHHPSAVCFSESWLPAYFILNNNLLLACENHRSVRELLRSLDYHSASLPRKSEGLANANTPQEWQRLTGSTPSVNCETINS